MPHQQPHPEYGSYWPDDPRHASAVEGKSCPLCGAFPHPLDCEGCAGWGWVASEPPKLCGWCKGSGRVACPPLRHK